MSVYSCGEMAKVSSARRKATATSRTVRVYYTRDKTLGGEFLDTLLLPPRCLHIAKDNVQVAGE